MTITDKELRKLLKLLRTENIACDFCKNQNGKGCVCPYLERFQLDPDKAAKYGIQVEK